MDIVCLGCCVLTFLLYYNTLTSDFVYDDRRAILQNPDILPSTPWFNLLGNDFWGTSLNYSGSHGSYRPLCVFSFRLNYFLSGFRPWSYHLVNIFLHVLATGQFVFISRCILSKRYYVRENFCSCTVASVLFAVHPVHVEAVASVVGRADVMAANFFFFAMICYMKHIKFRDIIQCKCDAIVRKSTASKRLIKLKFFENLSLMSCAVFAAAALFSKETGIGVVGVCIVYDFTRSNRKLSDKKRLASVLFLLLVALSLILLRVQISSVGKVQFSSAENPTSRASSVTTRFLTFLYLPVFSFLLLIYPNTLSFDWGMDAIPRITETWDWRNAQSVIFYGFLLIFAAKGLNSIFQKRRICASSKFDSCNCSNTPELNNNSNATKSICKQLSVTDNLKIFTRPRYKSKSDDVIPIILALLTFPFLPATNIFFYVGFVVGERILYIPSAGFCLLVGLGASKLYSKGFKSTLYVALITTVFWMSIRTVLRNNDWKDDESLYRSALHIIPAKAYGNLGSIISSQGKMEEAEFLYKKALEKRPNMADVHYNLGILYHKKSQFQNAICSFQTAIKYRPTLMPYLNLGTTLGDAGKLSEAIAILKQGSKINEIGLRDKMSHDNARISILLQLGRLHSEQGHLQKALTVYREAARSLPENYPPQRVYNVLGETLSKLQQFDEAERWFLAALKAEPSHIPAYITYGISLAQNCSRITEAEEWFKRAKNLAPDDFSVYFHYAEFLRTQGRLQEAAKFAETAAELNSKDVESAMLAGMLYKRLKMFKSSEIWYRKVVALQPLNPKVHVNLGDILYLNGKYEEATETYKSALRLEPNDLATIEHLKKIEQFVHFH